MYLFWWGIWIAGWFDQRPLDPSVGALDDPRTLEEKA
jgi:hypothetical protein